MAPLVAAIAWNVVLERLLWALVALVALVVLAVWSALRELQPTRPAAVEHGTFAPAPAPRTDRRVRRRHPRVSRKSSVHSRRERRKAA